MRKTRRAIKESGRSGWCPAAAKESGAVTVGDGDASRNASTEDPHTIGKYDRWFGAALVQVRWLQALKRDNPDLFEMLPARTALYMAWATQFDGEWADPEQARKRAEEWERYEQAQREWDARKSKNPATAGPPPPYPKRDIRAPRFGEGTPVSQVLFALLLATENPAIFGEDFDVPHGLPDHFNKETLQDLQDAAGVFLHDIHTRGRVLKGGPLSERAVARQRIRTLQEELRAMLFRLSVDRQSKRDEALLGVSADFSSAPPG